MYPTSSLKLLMTVGVCLVLLGACKGGDRFLQRPRAYPKVSLPSLTYRQCCPEQNLAYSFEVSQHAVIQRDSSLFFDINQQNPNWINIHYPAYNATIYISYIPVQGVSIYKRKLNNGIYVDSTSKNSFQQLLKNSYTLVYKHSSKASEIKDSAFVNAYGIRGMFFNISGGTATKYQFFATDSTKNYLRGALYFDTSPNEDSLRPLNEHFVKDLKHMVETLRWKP